MKKILLVDDSALMRQIMTDILQKMPNVASVQVAHHGQNCLDILQRKNDFDLILMDIEMPVMDGITALKQIKQQYSTPVVMLTAISDQATTIRALECGAADFIEKPVNLRVVHDEWIRELYSKIKNICGGKTRTSSKLHQPNQVRTKQPQLHPAAVVIGASTGGPKALLTIISKVRQTRLPIFIVQHMPAGFTRLFAERLNEESGAEVVEATDQLPILNKIYLCPGNYHLTLQAGRIRLDQREKRHGTRPAVDYLFETAAQEYGTDLTAFILTGMGHDGTAGLQKISAAGGYVIAQDEASCTVFGMPRAAIAAQVVDQVCSLTEIGEIIQTIVR